MRKHQWLMLSLWATLLLGASTAQATIFSGTFTGIVTGSRINALDPVNAGNIDGERANGTFFFDTDLSSLPPYDISVGPNDALFTGLSAGLTFSVHGYDLGFAGPSSDGFLADVGLHSDTVSQSLELGSSQGPYWFAAIGFSGPANSLFSNFDLATFNPSQIDLSSAQANFFAGRDFGGNVLIDGLTFDGYGAVGVAEPATAGLMMAGIVVLLLRRRQRMLPTLLK